MSEPIVVTDPAPAPAADPAPAQDTDWKAEARKWEQRAKDNKRQLDEAAPKISEYDRLIEASKSDMQRHEEARTAAEQRAAKAEADALRYRIAAMHGVGADDLDLLGDGDEDTLTRRAERIADRNRRLAEYEAAAAGKPAVPSARPVTAPLKPGASPTVLSQEDADYALLFPGG